MTHSCAPTLLRELTGDLHLVSMLFPYLPTPAHRRRNRRARASLEEIFSAIAASRKNSGQAKEDDMLQALTDSRYRDGRATTKSEVTGLLVALLFAGHHTSATIATWTAARLLPPRRLAPRRHVGADTPRHRPRRAARDGRAAPLREGGDAPTPHDADDPPPRAPPVHRTGSRRRGARWWPATWSPRSTGTRTHSTRTGGGLAYTAFGAGRHACLGEGYAYLQINVVLSHPIC
ncbi:hypothetical protein QOZ80_2BG0184720 [Eleusine coracana subsp. coracana]|nr:hypothetical protein QOZ80_2BG0184720 [Eleusine coracana subsp. coracana]